MIRFNNVSKVYEGGAEPVRALQNVSLHVREGEFVVVAGPSGSGKSTLLHLMGTLDEATSGEIEIAGASLSALNDDQRTLLRRHKIGFVFQFFHLLPTLTALENVIFPALLDGTSTQKARLRGHELLARMGLERRTAHTPDQLSGGEMQRVAIARALIHDPPILLADEPTGNLDSQKGKEILTLLQTLNREQKKTIVMVTHDREAALFGRRFLELRDGNIFTDRSNSTATAWA
ncbi:MAG TPA: ABC transporter ATP-binding protein [Bdellovibrionota bacterium]|nr:ABC transporter ATP-binding protein [Bdellovibrionota bacterium]